MASQLRELPLTQPRPLQNGGDKWTTRVPLAELDATAPLVRAKTMAHCWQLQELVLDPISQKPLVQTKATAPAP